MDNPEATENVMCAVSQQLLPIENNCQPVKNALLNTDDAEPFKNVDQISNSDNQIPVESTNGSSQDANIAVELSSVVPTDTSMPPLPPLPKDDNGQLPQPPVAPQADYNMQNYANYNNYMYNYNNYYGYPYPQYQWDYNSQQYYQPYQNYYNYNLNQTNQPQTSKPPPPPPDAVQLPVEEKPANKSNTTVDDSNRYSPTAETDDDDPTKVLSENKKSDVLIEQPQTTNPVLFQTAPTEQIDIQQNMPESIDNIIQQTLNPPTTPFITPMQQDVPVIAQLQPCNIQAQQSTYLIKPPSQVQSFETVNEVINQQLNSPVLNGKDDSIEKVSKASTVLGKSQAKKRLMAFSMMKQKLQEQNNSITDNQSPDTVEGNDGEFVPEHNVFQTVTKKKVVTNKKVAKVIKAQQTIEQIEEMKKDELLQGNNAALYQHLLRAGGNEAPILQKLGIESLAEKYSAKIREQDKRSSRHHHRRRDEPRRGHKYRRRSHSKSRSRSRSTEKPKMRALEVKSWKDFVNGGFHFDRFRRFKMDEAEEIKDKERKSKKKKRHGDSRSDAKHQKNESNIPSDSEKGNGDQKFRYNLLDRKKEILKGLEVNTSEGDFSRDFPSYIIRYTKNKPYIKFSENPANATYHLQNRQQMFATLKPEIEAIVLKFLSAMKPKKLKENLTDNNYSSTDERLLVMMKDKNIYPFKGWWPKTNFIVTQVKEDPNVEIDDDVVMNEITISKRTKKSRFNDDTSLVDLRTTVPSKWDSDYDGSPAADNKVAYVEVSQSVKINTNDNVCVIQKDKNSPLDMGHQEEAMDTVSDVGEDEPKIEVNVCPVLPVPTKEPQEHAKLNTEYEEFLKIVKDESDMPITATCNNLTAQRDSENNLPMKFVSLNNESVQDESEEYMSTKSSDESISANNAAEGSESNDGSFIEEISTIDINLKKKKKDSNNKSKKFKNKESKKKKHKSSSSESSRDSESESDSSLEDSDSESTDSTSTVEKKKKNKSKNKKKRKTKINYKKKHRGDKNKIKSPEDVKDANSSILNLLEKAFNVEIKKRPLDSNEPKQKKKKRKHEKKENDENNDKFQKVKDHLKETFTKLVKTEKVDKYLPCDDSTVSEVLKYLKMDDEKEKKNKKSKKSSKRKYNSDISDDDKTPKKSRLVDGSSKSTVNDKKKKSKKKKSLERKSVEFDERVQKKKSKKKSKTSDTSEAEDIEKINQNNFKNDSDHFFGLRPNEWNMNKKSSMRGVVNQSEEKIIKNKSSVHDSRRSNKNIRKKKSYSPVVVKDKKSGRPSSENKNKSEMLKLPNVFDEHVGQIEKIQKRDVNIISDVVVSENIITTEKNLINFINSDCESNEENNEQLLIKSDNECYNDLLQLKNDVQPTELLKKSNSEQHCPDKDLNSIFKPQIQSTPLDLYEKPPITCNIIKPAIEAVTYREKVKMNLKKLSTCQNVPFVIGFSLPLNKPKTLNLDIINNFIVAKEEDNPKVNESIVDKPKVDKPKDDEIKVDKTKLIKSDKPKMVVLHQTELKNPNVIKIESPKFNAKNDNLTTGDSYDWDDSDESNTNKSLMTSTDTSDYSSYEEESEQFKSTNVLKNVSLSICNKNKTFSDSKVNKLEEHTSDMFKTNSSSDSKNKEQELPLEFDNAVKKEITTLSNLADLSEQHLDYNTVGLKINIKPEKMKKNDTDSMYSQNSSIDVLEVSKSNNELITQWTSDWIMLDKSVTEIKHSSNSKSSNEELQLKKKSRWDKPPIDDKIKKSQSLNSEQEDYKDEINFSTDKLKHSSSPSSNANDLSKEQNQTCEIMSIDCMNDVPEIDPFDVYDNCTEVYDNYRDTPMYSEMKTIDNDLLQPVDYSVYENFNPDYNYYHTEDSGVCKSVDTDTSEYGILSAIPTTDETVSQNIFEILPSDNISVDQVESSNDKALNEKNDTINIDTQDVIVKNEKLDIACRDELFVNLYNQYFQHYNQNPIKYSLSDPVISNINDVKVYIPDNLTPQENLSETNNIMPIPLQSRAYACIIEDDNTTVYLTSDNYMAFCAVEDKCMVHISINTCNRVGVENDVRHCFNVSLNGSINEYWLHADLIPFHVPSDAESGVFSDDEIDSFDSNSEHEEDLDTDNNDNDESLIDNEGEIVDNIDENTDNWLDDPYILKNFNIEHDSHINQENYMLSSSECETDGSDFSDSYVEIINDQQNITENQDSFETNDDKKKYQNVIDVATATAINVYENTDNGSINSDLLVESKENIQSSEQLVLDVAIKNGNDTLMVVDENNLTLKINTINNDVLVNLIEKEDNDNNSVKLQEQENNKINQSGVNMKEEIPTFYLSRMNTIINQQKLIQKLKIQAKEKIHVKKLPDTVMVCYSDNIETIKHPFLGLFQPPTKSILSKKRSSNPLISKLSKHVTFADGIRPGHNLAASPSHDDVGRPLSPPPLKRLMRETLKFKRNMYPFKKSKVRTKLTMVNKKVAKVTPSIKTTNSSVIDYYISRRRLEDLPNETVLNSSLFGSNFTPNNISDQTENSSSPPRPTREVTPVPFDNDSWNDDDTVKNNK